MKSITELISFGIQQIIDHRTEGGIPFEDSKTLSETHATREFCLVLQGESDFLLDGKLYPANPGTLFMIDHWIPHSSGYGKNRKPLIHLWGYLLDSDCRVDFKYINENGEYSTIASDFFMPLEFPRFINRRWDLLSSVEKYDNEELKGYMFLPFLCILDEIMLCFTGKTAVKKKLPTTNLIESLKSFIRSNNGSGCSLEKLEKYSGYNRYYLAHIFKERTGYSIGNYVNYIREEYAADAVAHGVSQKKIAAELGFSSPSSFCVWLKQHREHINNIRKRELQNRFGPEQRPEY